MEQNKGKFYDVSNSTDHQVYSGVSGESQATTNAVNKTKGIVMLYDHVLLMPCSIPMAVAIQRIV